MSHQNFFLYNIPAFNPLNNIQEINVEDFSVYKNLYKNKLYWSSNLLNQEHGGKISWYFDNKGLLHSKITINFNNVLIKIDEYNIKIKFRYDDKYLIVDWKNQQLVSPFFTITKNNKILYLTNLSGKMFLTYHQRQTINLAYNDLHIFDVQFFFYKETVKIFNRKIYEISFHNFRNQIYTTLHYKYNYIVIDIVSYPFIDLTIYKLKWNKTINQKVQSNTITYNTTTGIGKLKSINSIKKLKKSYPISQFTKTPEKSINFMSSSIDFELENNIELTDTIKYIYDNFMEYI